MVTNTLMPKRLGCNPRLAISKGFSLTELLAVLSISSIMFFYALPQFSSVIGKNNLERQLDDITLAIRASKAAAVQSNNAIVLCSKQRTAESCNESKAKGVSDWSNGWIIFADENNDKKLQHNEVIIKVTSYNQRRCSVTWNRGNVLSFHQFGMVKSALAGRFEVICGEFTAQLIVNWVGRVRRG